MKIDGPVTAETITDEQIRDLMKGADRPLRTMCKLALNDAPTYLRAAIIKNARRRLAEIWNARCATDTDADAAKPLPYAVRCTCGFERGLADKEQAEVCARTHRRYTLHDAWNDGHVTRVEEVKEAL